MDPPHQKRPPVAVILLKIILGNLNIQTLIPIPYILLFQSTPVIFRMAEDKDLPAFFYNCNKDPGRFGFRKDGQLFAVMDCLCIHRGMAGMRRKEDIVKAADQGFFSILNLMAVQAEELLGK